MEQYISFTLVERKEGDERGIVQFIHLWCPTTLFQSWYASVINLATWRSVRKEFETGVNNVGLRE